MAMRCLDYPDSDLEVQGQRRELEAFEIEDGVVLAFRPVDRKRLRRSDDFSAAAFQRAHRFFHPLAIVRRDKHELRFERKARRQL